MTLGTEGYAVWGWGEPGAGVPSTGELAALAPVLANTLGFPMQPPEVPRPVTGLPASRVSLPAALAGLASHDPNDRARHGLGRSYRDVLCGIRGEVSPSPDLVLRPPDEAAVVAVLDWASAAGVAVVPFGGGTSVVGGVTPHVSSPYAGVVSLDLCHLTGVIEVDEVSRAARIRGGTLGPHADAALRPHGLTMRFHPQSYLRSTVGGWIATRAAGHYASKLQHIDDIVQSVRAITPTGTWESRRLPGSGAGPSPDRMLLGSEGTLGVVTEAWVRLQPRPTFRAGASLAAANLSDGAAALLALLQSGLAPDICRLVDPIEATMTGTLTTGEAVLVLGAESAHGPVDAQLAAAVELCRDHGLRNLTGQADGAPAGGPAPAEDEAGDAWRSAFRFAPLLRERMILLGVLVETFETAVTWDRFDALIGDVTEAVRAAIREVCGGGTVTVRVTHAYPDGCAPYFTVLAPARRGSELAQWTEIKAAASDALMAAGGTITHHHAVGRDHLPWYRQQRPDVFAAAVAAARAAVDPASVMNPGVLA